MTEGHISKIHLFAKGTDAPHIKAGFVYQELKTLETWLANSVYGNKEDVYCDFEEDIFQRDLGEFKSTFRQVKLYSSKNFSFASEEVRKALSHFFMLFVKGEYLYDKVEFIFETNTSIAGKSGDNDSKLLKKWFEKQDNLDDKLVEAAVEKIRSIVDEHMTVEYDKSLERGEVGAKDVLLVYKSIPKETWKLFVSSIKWHFEGISSEEALKNSVANCKELIRKLPFPINSEDYDKVFDTLRGVISDKSYAKLPEERKLTNQYLDECLLSIGEKDDQTYLESFKKWEDSHVISELNIGEFYEILHHTKHCRRNSHLKNHLGLWLYYLNQYVQMKDVSRFHIRDAIYEIVWVAFLFPTDENIKSSLGPIEHLVEDYFFDFEGFDSATEIEDSHNLLTIVVPNQLIGKLDIDVSQVQNWIERFDRLLGDLKKSSTNNDFLCHLFEQEAFAFLLKAQVSDAEFNLKGAKRALGELKKLLPDAPFFPVSQLGNKVDQISDMLVKIGLGKEMLSMLEDFSEELVPLIKEREGNLSLAKKYTQIGTRYLNSSEPKDLLKVISNFHNAKDLYYNEDAFEGYLLCLLNLAQFYSMIGMKFASKYYCLVAVWFCFERGIPKLYEKIPGGCSLLMFADFEQGSWICTLHDFQVYLNTREEFKTKEFDPEADEVLGKLITIVATIFALTPKISSQLTYLVQALASQMGQLYEHVVKDNVEILLEHEKRMGVKGILAGKIKAPPVNDIGKSRTITWQSLGIRWGVNFPNDYLHNSVGEEFAASLQVIQTEMVSSKLRFPTRSTTVDIQIQIVKERKIPKKLNDQENIWEVYIPITNSFLPNDKNFHDSILVASGHAILQSVSELSEAQFRGQFFNMLAGGLRKKTLASYVYQRAFRSFYNEEEFNSFKRDGFTNELLDMETEQNSALEV